MQKANRRKKIRRRFTRKRIYKHNKMVFAFKGKKQNAGSVKIKKLVKMCNRNKY